MSHPEVQEIVETLARLQNLVSESREQTPENIHKQTEVISGKISTLMQKMEQGEINLPKDDIIALSSALATVLSIMSGEIESSKQEMRQRMQASKAHKSYSQS